MAERRLKAVKITATAPVPEYPTEPKRILDPSFQYTPAAATDVQRTWRKYGWVPPSEQSNYGAK